MYLHLTFFKIDRKNTVFDCRKEKLLSIFIRNLIDIIGPCLKDIRKLSEKLSFIRNYLKTDEICNKILILFERNCLLSCYKKAFFGGKAPLRLMLIKFFKLQDHKLLKKLHPGYVQEHFFPWPVSRIYGLQIQKTFRIIRCRENFYLSPDSVSGCDHTHL